jgi:folate-binding protein YgfZ
VISLDDYSALRDGAGWIERLDAGRLRLRGRDRKTYLHGLLTNDIESLTAGTGIYAALLTAQGRMISDMHVYEIGDALIVTLPRSLAAPMRERLDQFVFSEDVQIEDETATTAQIGVYGPLAAGAVTGLGSPEIVLPSRELGLDGFEIVTGAERVPRVIEAIESDGARAVDIEAVEVLRVEAGVPRFLVDMTDATIPLEAGIEGRAISMTKGCYPGQEVIVRVLHRGGGRVAKKLVGMVLDETAAEPPRGAAVRAGDREIGVLTSIVRSVQLDRPLALGYVHRDFTEPGTTVEVDGVAATIRELPVFVPGS